MKKITLTLLCFLLISFAKSQAQSLNILFVKDSAIAGPTCTSPLPRTQSFIIFFDQTGLLPTDQINLNIDYGDGTSFNTSYPVSSIQYYTFISQYTIPNSLYFQTYHTYTAFGNYTVTYTLTGPGGITSSRVVPDEVILNPVCYMTQFRYFNDINNNCVKDPGEAFVAMPSNVFPRIKNGVADVTVLNDFYLNPGINYTFYPPVFSGYSYATTCLPGGVLNFTVISDTIFNIPLYCSGSTFDLYTDYYFNGIKLATPVLIEIAPGNSECAYQSGQFTLTLDPNLMYQTSSVAPSSISGNQYTWNFINLRNNNYSTPGSPKVTVFTLPDPSLQIGDTVCNTVSITPVTGDSHPSNNTTTLCRDVRSSWDPNEKLVFPSGTGPQGYIDGNTQLTYTIHFQNTGNAPAQFVYVIDTLSSQLDLHTLEILYASHACSYTISGNVLRFDFININLPDSGTSQSASRGSIVYRIKPIPSVQIGSTIQNRADIFFDNNPAVLTNTTLNTIQSLSGLNTNSDAKSHLIASPNPFHSTLMIDLPESSKWQLSVFDYTGRLTDKFDVEGKHAELPLNHLIPGFYIIKATDSSQTGEIKVEKF